MEVYLHTLCKFETEDYCQHRVNAFRAESRLPSTHSPRDPRFKSLQLLASQEWF